MAIMQAHWLIASRGVGLVRTVIACRRGERLVAKVPHGHWKTSTLIAALDYRGIRCSATVDGAINGDVFAAFVEQLWAVMQSVLDAVSPTDAAHFFGHCGYATDQK